MGVKLTVGRGARVRRGLGRYLQGIVRALKPVHHKARYGLGFQPDMRQRRRQWKKDQERRIARTLGREPEWEHMEFPHLSRTFTSAGMIYPRQDNAQGTMLMIEKGFQNISINVIDKGADTSKDV